MTERVSCAALIDFVLRLVNDVDAAVHSRDDVQAALDVYRMEARYVSLMPVPTKTGAGTSYLTFEADSGDWETDGTLYDGAYAALTPATADWTAGRWAFATEPVRPVHLLGWTHDPYAAAADLLTVRAAQLSEEYDFKTGPDSYSRSQRGGQLLALAGQYRAMSKTGGLGSSFTQMERVDVLPG